MDNTVGYYFSLSRTLVFAPFYILGYYIKNKNINFESLKNNKFLILITALLSIVAAILIYFNIDKINHAWLYNSLSYIQAESNILIRIVIYLIALIFSFFILLISPKNKIPLLTHIGTNCLTIFLFHGFMVKYLVKIQVSKYFTNYYSIWIYVLLAALIIILIFSSKPLVKIMNKIFR